MAEAPSASSNPPTGVTHQQFMSRPSGVVLEGETSGPNYGAVNGAQPERTSQRRGASTVLPLGRQTQMLGPDTGDSSGQAVPTVPAGGPVTVSDRAGASVLRLPTGSAERVAVLETERTGPGATEQRQHAHTHVHTAEPQLQAPPPPPPQPKSTIGTSQQPLQPGVSFSPMRENGYHLRFNKQYINSLSRERR